MKNSYSNGYNSNSAVCGARSTATIVTATTTSSDSAATGVTCVNNSSNGAVCTAANSVQFTVACATDYYGGGLFNTAANTLQQCIETCSTTSGCVAVDSVGTTCYVKGSLQAGVSNSNAAGAKLVGYTIRSSTTTTAVSTTTTTSAGSTCNNGSVYEGFKIACGTDYAGGDLINLQTASIQACIDACASTPGCVTLSYLGHTCYLKSTLNAGVPYSAVTGAARPQSSTTTTTTTTARSPLPRR